jgi:hypothetical protein
MFYHEGLAYIHDEGSREWRDCGFSGDSVVGHIEERFTLDRPGSLHASLSEIIIYSG